jgi:hypothetical protein
MGTRTAFKPILANLSHRSKLLQVKNLSIFQKSHESCRLKNLIVQQDVVVFTFTNQPMAMVFE